MNAATAELSPTRPGLIRDCFEFAADGKPVVEIYLWQSKPDAEKFFTHELAVPWLRSTAQPSSRIPSRLYFRAMCPANS